MGEVSLQNLTKTRANVVSSRLAFVPRAFLQIFIKTTPHHRLAGYCGGQLSPTISVKTASGGAQPLKFTPHPPKRGLLTKQRTM